MYTCCLPAAGEGVCPCYLFSTVGITLTSPEYRILVEHSPVMIWRAGTDALCDYFNETWLGFTGRTMEQELGNGWAEGVHPEDLKRCVEHYLTCFERRQSFEMEYRLRRYDGVYRYIFDRGAPFCGADGAFKGFIGSCVDIEERRRAQFERERQHEQTVTSAHQFERWVLDIVSHDLRNPLALIELATRSLLAQPNDPEVVKRHAGRVMRGVDRMKRIVEDLFDLSRVKRGGVPLTLAPTDLHRICAEVVEEFRETAAGRSLAFELNGENGSGTWDEARIQQAVSNLLSNAIKHSPPGTPVRVRLLISGNPVSVEIHNEGCIPDQVRPFVFNPFTSGGRSRGRAGGLGLGLFIAKALVEAHSGEVQLQSSAEEGTTFRIVLPREPLASRSVA